MSQEIIGKGSLEVCTHDGERIDHVKERVIDDYFKKNNLNFFQVKKDYDDALIYWDFQMYGNYDIDYSVMEGLKEIVKGLQVNCYVNEMMEVGSYSFDHDELEGDDE